MSEFSQFWSLYPRKRHKVAAEKAWRKAVSRFGAETILAALREMKETEWQRRKLEFIPHAASWINATDFGDEFEGVDDPEPLPLFPRQPHWCPMCEYPHSWDCGEHPACCLSYEVCCPEWQARIEAKRGRRDGLGSTRK